MTDPKNKLAVRIRACMEDQGLRHEEQTFDNQPLEIVEAFPDEDDFQLTQEFLERRVFSNCRRDMCLDSNGLCK